MTPRPCYRWKTFWLGLFVASFLGWAWWDSNSHETVAFRSGWTRTTYLYSATGETIFARGCTIEFGVMGNAWGFSHNELPVLPPFWELGDGVSGFKVPDPLVFFSFLGLWAGWLVAMAPPAKASLLILRG
ncbi:hypothetical protein OKA05_08660 [Luteolibacter arcticus]|uniref:Uncharacterized protein n=1 Tax=Luteolibacter arcticus TaxID=1581411 RepID=A0ABT3GH78_9BACT|nr:hypothetical protein [Luteolibacter arcticus]MCW1922623.1 hypothetical protein [Luteolibacter arcticus]